MKHIVFGFVVAVFLATSLASCNKQESALTENHVRPLVEMSFSATTIEADNSEKTSTDLSAIYWQDGDKISVFTLGDAGNYQFSLAAGAGTTSANFQGSAVQSTCYYALYPYQQDARLDGTTIKGVSLPRRQVATAGSFNPRCNLMVAETDGENISFKQVCSYIKVTPSFDCKQITIKSNNNGCPLTGKCDIVMGQDGSHGVSVTADTAVVTLVPADGASSIAAGHSYLIAAFPSTLSDGFMVSFTGTDDRVYIYKHTSSVTLVRRNILDIMGFQWTATVDYVRLWDGGPYWATVNMGATSPTEYGDFFAWGEIEPYYQTYSVNGRAMTTTYRNGKTNGYVSTSYPFTSQIWDASDVLLPQYDVACQLWGGNWEMPTDADFTGLTSNCVATYESSNVSVRFTGRGPYADKSIVLPLGGGYNGSTDNSSVTTGGYYWSSKRNGDDSYFFKISSTERPSVNSWTRYRGYMVRPVRRVQ